MIEPIYIYDDAIGKVEYVEHMGSDLSVVNSARVSFGKHKQLLDEKDEKLINYLIKHRHTSTLEHCAVTFRFKVPLFVRSQHHRHRTWCLAGDTEVTFNRPDRWRKGQHCKQTANNGNKFTMSRLYRLWNDPVHHKKIKKMLVRVYDEKSKKFTVSNVENVIHSGKKQVFKVTLEDGKELKCSKDHKILTKRGWQTLEQSIGLNIASTGKATMSIEAEFLTNGTTNLWRSYDWMKNQRESGYSVSEIAQNANCSYHNIRKWLKIHNLQFDQVKSMLDHNKKHGVWNKGKSGYKTNRSPLTDEHKDAIRQARSGERSNFWKGGVTPQRQDIARWTTSQAKQVHKKYNYTCQECKQKGGNLHAHHIVPVVEDISKAKDFNNLLTVCQCCHYKIHKGKEMARNKKGTPLSGIYSKVVSVELIGEEDVYDLTIKGDNHNFVANGIVVHNCYNEVSRRYTDFNIEFYEPLQFRTQHKSNRQASNENDLIDPVWDTREKKFFSERVRDQHEDCLYLYEEMLKAGICREQARGVLPQNMYTEYYGTCNLNNLLKFVDLRIHEGAQWEIQKVAEAILKITKELYPITVGAYEKSKLY